MSNSRAFKVMLLGEIGVGKSSIAQRLVFDRFEQAYKPTIGVDVYRYEADADGQRVPLILWDSDGNLGDAIFRHVYLKEASAAIIVGDASRPQTVEAMVNIGRSFRERLPGRCVTFVLNKMDLLGNEPPDLPEEISQPGATVFQASALTGDNVQLAFKETAATLLRQAA